MNASSYVQQFLKTSVQLVIIIVRCDMAELYVVHFKFIIVLTNPVQTFLTCAKP